MEEETEQDIELMKEKGRQARGRRTHLRQQATRIRREKWERCGNIGCKARNNFDTCLGAEDCKYLVENKKRRIE